MASGFPFPFVNIVDETARQLGLSTSEALQLITNSASFQSLVNQGTDPLTAARIVSMGEDVLPTPPEGKELISPDVRDRAGAFRAAHPVGQPIEQKPAPKPGDAEFVGPLKPTVPQKVAHFLDRISPDLPLHQIMPNDPPAVRIVKALGNTLALTAKVREAKRARGRAGEEFELEKQERRARIAESEATIETRRAQEEEAKVRTDIARLGKAVSEKDLIDSLKEDLARHTRSEQAKILKADAGPERLFEHLNKGEIDEFNRKRGLYIPQKELERQTVSAALFADEEIKELFGLDSMEDAIALYDSLGARSIIDDLMNSHLQRRVHEENLLKLEREEERDEAQISLELTNMYDELLKEEAEISAKLTTAEAFERILSAGSPEEQADLRLKLGVTPLDLIENSPEQFRKMLEFIDERKLKLLDAVERFGIPGLSEQLLQRIAPIKKSSGDDPLEMAKRLGLVPGDTEKAEEKLPLLQRMAQGIDEFFSAISPFRLIPDEGRTQRDMEFLIPGAEDIFLVFQRGYNYFSRATLDASVNRALEGRFDDQHSFKILKQKISEELAVQGITASDEELTHDAAVIAWYVANRPGERAPRRLLKIAGKLPRETRTPPARER
jgi:hypothetical protein